MRSLKIMAYFFVCLAAMFHFASVQAKEGLLQKQAEEQVQSTYHHASWHKALSYAQQHLPHEGRLVRKPDGYVYLKVDDDYIRKLFPLLEVAREGYREPPYFRTREAPGAHISIFYVDEHVDPKELGQTFHFDLEDIAVVRPSRTVSYVVLQVKSPELEKLRQKYGLPPKLHGHEFHISLAKKSHHYKKKTHKR